MNNKRDARLNYYEGIRQAMMEHIKTTEEGIRNLEGVKSSKIEKLVADIHKEHEKLLKRIDREIRQEKARSA